MSALGSIKIRQTAKGVSLRATGAAATDMAEAMAAVLQVIPAGLAKVTTVTFEDHGQDFLEWDLDAAGVVIDSRPYQAAIWVGMRAQGLPVVGGLLTVADKAAGPLDGRVMSVKYPIAELTVAWRRPVGGEVQGG